MWWRSVFAAGFLALCGVAVADQPAPQGSYWTFPGTALKNWCPEDKDDPKCQVRLMPPPATPPQDWCSLSSHYLTDPESATLSKSEREAMKGMVLNTCPQFRFGPLSWCSQHPTECAAAIKAATPAPPVAHVEPAVPTENWCPKAFAILDAPGIDPFLKQAILEKARNRGCMQ
jgi:hypothetical protein